MDCVVSPDVVGIPRKYATRNGHPVARVVLFLRAGKGDSAEDIELIIEKGAILQDPAVQ
jgi:hypothetical protein